MTDPEPDDARRALLSEDAELPCGRSVDELLEQAADHGPAPADAHQSGCPHCQAALREFAELWAPVREQAAQRVDPPATLIASIKKQIDRLVVDVWHTLELTDGGVIRVAARAVAALARDAARRVPGVRVALGRSTETKLAARADRATREHRHPHGAVGVLGRTAVVDLALAVSYGDPVHDVAQAVQQRVIDELRRKVGLKSVTVNVTVDEVLPAPARPAPPLRGDPPHAG